MLQAHAENIDLSTSVFSGPNSRPVPTATSNTTVSTFSARPENQLSEPASQASYFTANGSLEKKGILAHLVKPYFAFRDVMRGSIGLWTSFVAGLSFFAITKVLRQPKVLLRKIETMARDSESLDFCDRRFLEEYMHTGSPEMVKDLAYQRGVNALAFIHVRTNSKEAFDGALSAHRSRGAATVALGISLWAGAVTDCLNLGPEMVNRTFETFGVFLVALGALRLVAPSIRVRGAVMMDLRKKWEEETYK